MSVYRFFDSLSFKQKITLGFSALIIIMVTGMSYMLYQFTSVSKMTSEISDRYQPVTSTAGKALELAQASANLLHEHLLDYDAEKIEDHSQKMNQMKNNVMILIDYANTEALNINKDKLYRAIEIAEEIKGYSQRIEQLSYEYNENHPVITYATENLNPTGIEYLGYIAQILNEVDDLGLSIDEVILLSEMRQSWSQLMSHMRTIITTRNQTSMDNVYSYSEANLQQHNRLENMKPDLGLYNLAELKQLRERYISRLEYIREKLDAEVWREDTRIMITNVMPLYDELQYILEETLKTEITSSKDAADLLTTKINTINFVYTTLVLSGILLAIIISIFITRSLRKPLLRLVSATKDVADGKFKIQTEISSNDEISRLNESFNEMVVKLKQSQTELLSAKEDAEQSSQAKSLFLRSMSHELRTPMNAVLGYSQILSMEPLTEEQHRYITEITRSGNHLLELINQVLDLARIESDNLSIDLKTVKLSDIVNHCLPLLINNAMESNNIQLINNIENDTHNVIADPLNLRQVFINLISNAIKYNKKNGTITLNVEEIDNQKIRILITDTGIGLSPDEINKIFEPFQRLSFVNSAVEGTGIGLTITRQLIEKMNGEMGVDSVKDAGSTFWFSLPLSQQQPSSDSIITDFPKQSSQKHANTDNQYKILYIEDNPANYQLMQSIINRHNNMSLIHAASAEEGLELTTSILPDLILMDISLPGMNGIEAMHILKSNKKTSHVPVIAVTANALTDDVSSGLSSGFDEYITKPIDIPQLNAVLEQYLKPHLIYDNIT